MTPDLIRLTAQEAVRLLRARQVSPLELIDAALARIAATDHALNALPTLCAERARDHARRLLADEADAASAPGWLAGLPIAVKDLNDVAGVRTTYGSPIYAEHVPARSDIMIERLEANGALVLGKSNTPEFGAGANTFNPVFGETRNPWNTALTCGGSSGGSAVALATGQVWLATGSDLGGSLRTPASFCSVVGLRPSPGRVPHGPEARPFDTLSVDGPMGRTVGDVALMLDAMVARHPEDPLSLELPPALFQIAAAERRRPRRVAFSADLGIGPVDAEVRQLCAAAAQRFGEAGVAVEEACPDFSDAVDCFGVLRALG
ncbi:MAG TPA: amidase family protein, partial [Dongiaceae bacterium]|nr:amidase family protein [Dongiaceae bacterium]